MIPLLIILYKDLDHLLSILYQFMAFMVIIREKIVMENDHFLAFFIISSSLWSLNKINVSFGTILRFMCELGLTLSSRYCLYCGD